VTGTCREAGRSWPPGAWPTIGRELHLRAISKAGTCEIFFRLRTVALLAGRRADGPAPIRRANRRGPAGRAAHIGELTGAPGRQGRAGDDRGPRQTCAAQDQGETSPCRRVVRRSAVLTRSARSHRHSPDYDNITSAIGARGHRDARATATLLVTRGASRSPVATTASSITERSKPRVFPAPKIGPPPASCPGGDWG